jgi:hypothetical protein
MYTFVVYMHIYTRPNTCEFNSCHANSKLHIRNNSKATKNYFEIIKSINNIFMKTLNNVKTYLI